MKYLTTSLCLLLALYAVPAKAQVKHANRLSKFDQAPIAIYFTETQLAVILQSTTGQHIAMPLDNNFILTGTVKSNEVKYKNLQTVIIKLPAFANSLFSLTKQYANNQVNYVGRIFNASFSDGYVLKKIKNSHYQLIKINVENTLTDCSL